MNRDFQISPYEGQALLPFSIILVIVFSGLGIFIGGIVGIVMWILVAILGWFLFSMVYFRISSNWAKIHYPVMIRYANFAGLASGLYPDKHVDERIDIAILLLLKSLYPKMSDPEIESLYTEIYNKPSVFHDRDMIIKMLNKRIPNTNNEEHVDKLLGMYKEGSESNMKVAHAVSELIKFKHGEPEQLEYMFAVMSGKAK